MTAIDQSMNEMKLLVGQMESELNLLQSGRKASAPKCRASLQKIKNPAHIMRGSVMAYVKELPTVSRVKKTTAVPAEDNELPIGRPVLKRSMTQAPEIVVDDVKPVVKKSPPKKKSTKSVKILIGEKAIE